MDNFVFFMTTESEAAEKRRKEREEHSVEAYETKFKEIEQITGERDLDKLVERFIQGIQEANPHIKKSHLLVLS
jgi:hypothetical protein